MRFHDIFKDFMKMPFFDYSEHLTLSILEIPVLYEYWSALQIIDILCNMNDWKKEEHFIDKNEFGYRIKLRTGDNPLIKLSSEDKNIDIYLFYQKQYDTYAGRYLKPDITLEMHVNRKLSRILVFDPKYRTELGAKDSNDPESAINKMHVYKDAIREDRNHIVEAAYAIYLGETIKYCSQDSNDGIGGVYLYPTEIDAKKGKEELKEIIQNFIYDKKV